MAKTVEVTEELLCNIEVWPRPHWRWNITHRTFYIPKREWWRIELEQLKRLAGIK